MTAACIGASDDLCISVIFIHCLQLIKLMVGYNVPLDTLQVIFADDFTGQMTQQQYHSTEGQ